MAPPIFPPVTDRTRGLAAVPEPEDDAPYEMTIDELARRTGMTVRNIRAHQSRGLLPPPEVRGRTGFYGPVHVTRVELIKEMQADGFNLEAIRRCSTARRVVDEVLRFTRAVTAPFEDETPEVLELGELAETFGGGDPKALERAIELGLVRHLGEGRYEQRSPRLARAGRELRELGVSPRRQLDVAADLRRHADGVGQGVRAALPRRGLEAVRGGRPPARALARGLRRARAPAPARRRVDARDVPDRHDRARRARAGQGDREDGRRRLPRGA
jgi:DNA-binding transcriptional MerR regulator